MLGATLSPTTWLPFGGDTALRGRFVCVPEAVPRSDRQRVNLLSCRRMTPCDYPFPLVEGSPLPFLGSVKCRFESDWRHPHSYSPRYFLPGRTALPQA
jgi:hypothetical protein